MFKNHLHTLKIKFQKLIYNYKTWNYYLQDKNNPNPLPGIILDFIISRMIILATLYIFLVSRIKKPYAALLLAIAVTVISSIGYCIRKKKKFESKKKEKLNNAAKDYILSHFAKMNNKEFKRELTKILANIKGFRNIKSYENYLEATYNNTPVAIGFYHAPCIESITSKEILKFINQIKNKGYKCGLFITPSTFSKSCPEILEIVEKTYNIQLNLIDGPGLLYIMEKFNIMPEPEVLNQVILREIEAKKIKINKLKKTFFTPKKIKSFIFYALLFSGISLFSRTYRIYYMIISLFLVLFAAVIYLKCKENAVNRDILKDNQ